MRRTLGSIVVAIVLASCAAAPPEKPPSAHPRPRVAAHTASAVAALPASPLPAPPSPPDSPSWHLVASAESEIHPVPFDDAVAIASGLAIATLGADGEFHLEPETLSGLPACHWCGIYVVGSGGRWATSPWIMLTSIGAGGRTAWYGHVYVRIGGQWRPAPPGRTTSRPRWSPSCLAAETTGSTPEAYQLLRTCDGMPAPLPGTTRHAVLAVERTVSGRSTTLTPLATPPEWTPVADGMRTGIPGVPPPYHHIATRSATEVYVLTSGGRRGDRGTEVLAFRFEGGNWTPIDGPAVDEVRSLALGPEGDLFAVGTIRRDGKQESQLLRAASADASWTRVDTGNVSPTEVAFIAGELYLFADDRLFRQRKAGAVLQLPGTEVTNAIITDVSPEAPARPSCDGLALVIGVPPPDKTDFSDVAGWLEGENIRLGIYRGQPTLFADVSPFARGAVLQAKLARKAPWIQPRLRCHFAPLPTGYVGKNGILEPVTR